MKQYLRVLIITMTIVLFSVVAYGADKPAEVIANGIVPAEWGTLRSATQGEAGYEARLFFEDKNGTVRMVVLTRMEDEKWALTERTDRKVVIIKRK